LVWTQGNYWYLSVCRSVEADVEIGINFVFFGLFWTKIQYQGFELCYLKAAKGGWMKNMHGVENRNEALM
jgi:hypothetical protein